MLGSPKAGELNPKQKEYYQKVVSGAERMVNIINDTLVVSKLERKQIDYKIVNFDISKLINETVSDLSIKTNERGIYLKATGTENPVFVIGDENRSREVISNLITNAIKFTKSGGITVALKSDLRNVSVEVVDTGVGIESEDIPKLFQKFGRLNSAYDRVAEAGGTGLGLYISKLYIETMGGNIGANSEGDGKGSTFWFTLPISKGSP
jgi:signal transduction histidine kinase